MKYILQSITSIPLFVLIIPQTILANGGLVTCAGPDCTFCDLFYMFNGVLDWLFGIVILIAVLLIAYAGFMLVFSRGDTSAISKGKSMLINTIIGIVIMLMAWTIVDTFMKLVMGGDFGVWNEVTECGEMFQPGLTIEGIALQQTSVTVANPSLFLSDAETSPHKNCPTCVSLDSMGIECKRLSSCDISYEFAERLAGLLAVHEYSMEITEAFPPSMNHKASCHRNGTCVDIVFDDRVFTETRVRTFINQAKALGFRAVYEPAGGGSCLGLTGSDCVQNVATGNHFSLYAN